MVIVVEVRDGTSSSEPINFSVNPSSHHGWLQVGSWVDPGYSSRYLAHHDGTPFFGIEHCNSFNLLSFGYDEDLGFDLYRHLRCQKKRRKRAGDYDLRGKIPNQVSIEERPEIVEQRERIGDWEGDTIIGAGKQGAIVTLVERKSRYTLLKQVANRTAAVVENAILDLLRLFQDVTHTITFDNGKEFANHQTIGEHLQSAIYFAHPYASWERGTNENTNGLIRQYFPKGSDFSLITDDQIVFVKERLNDRPRKCLDFQAPAMVFSQVSPGCT